MSVLISFLPPESAVSTALRNAAADSGESSVAAGPPPDPSKESWSQVSMLLASVIDELRWMRYEYRSVNSSAAGAPPKQVDRPGVNGAKRRRKGLTMNQRRELDPRMRGERGN